MGERRGAHRILVGKPEGRSLGRHRCRWKDNIKMDLQEVGRAEGTDWIDLAGSCECSNEPSGSIKYLVASQKGLCSME
jgi:hypothetical protein